MHSVLCPSPNCIRRMQCFKIRSFIYKNRFQIVYRLILSLWFLSEDSVTQRLCAVSTNTTVKNVEASRRHTRGQYAV